MRRGNEPKLVRNDAGEVVAVSLGSDFTAEHECGIAGIKRAFGQTTSIAAYGLARRKVTKRPPGLAWFETKDGSGFGHTEPHCRPASDYLRDELRIWRDNLSGAWDDSSFGVASNEPQTIAALREIFAALDRTDAVIALGGGMVAFDNPGLVLSIASRLPPSVIEQWEAADREAHEVRQAVEASGIEAALKAAGLRYFALSPKRWTDGGIKFWLNPMEQRENNSGWFTEAQLREWIEGKGPIPKRQAVAR